MATPLPLTDPCFDAPLPSAPTPGFYLEPEASTVTSTSLFTYVLLPLTHPTTFTFLFSALFFVLTVIPVTVCLSLSLARHRHESAQLRSRGSCPLNDGIGDAENQCENERVLSVWKIPFGSPIYYVDNAVTDKVTALEGGGDIQGVVIEKDDL